MLFRSIDQKKFLLACMKLVNEIASRFKCSRVSIGWLKDNYVKPIAISHLEKFDAHMDTVSRLEGVFEESLDQNEEIIIPGEVSRGTIVAAHSKYLKLQGLNQLVSFPLRIAEEPKAVVCLEKIEGFFEVCEKRGLDGSHGVIIPRENVKHLMLKEEVVAAVSQGKFGIYAVQNIDEAITIIEFETGAVGVVESSWNRPGGMDDSIEVFGDKGRSARSAVGMSSLPFQIACEVEMIVEIE